MDNLERVIEGCKNGDAKMQRELYQRYSPRFYALCRRYSNDDEMANSALVDGFLTVFQSIGSYRGEGSFEGWMHKIFLRKIVHVYRKNNRYRTTIESVSTDEAVDERYFSERVDIEKKIDVNDALLESLRKLTAMQQTVFNMVAVDGYTFKSVAEITKQGESTVKYHYYNACDKMKSLIIERLGEGYIKNLIG